MPDFQAWRPSATFMPTESLWPGQKVNLCNGQPPKSNSLSNFRSSCSRFLLLRSLSYLMGKKSTDLISTFLAPTWNPWPVLLKSSRNTSSATKKWRLRNLSKPETTCKEKILLRNKNKRSRILTGMRWTEPFSSRHSGKVPVVKCHQQGLKLYLRRRMLARIGITMTRMRRISSISSQNSSMWMIPETRSSSRRLLIWKTIISRSCSRRIPCSLWLTKSPSDTSFWNQDRRTQTMWKPLSHNWTRSSSTRTSRAFTSIGSKTSKTRKRWSWRPSLTSKSSQKTLPTKAAATSFPIWEEKTKSTG